MTCLMGLVETFFDGSMAHRRLDGMPMNKKSQTDDFAIGATAPVGSVLLPQPAGRNSKITRLFCAWRDVRGLVCLASCLAVAGGPTCGLTRRLGFLVCMSPRE